MTIYTMADMLKHNATRPASTGAIEVSEDAQGSTGKLVAPGIAPEQFELTLVGRTLTIKGEATAAEHNHDERRHLREFAVTAVARRIEFPLSVEGDQISATSANGILTVRVPKSANAQPKRIAVNGITPTAE